MSLASQISAAFNRVGQDVKALRSSVPVTVDQKIAAATPAIQSMIDTSIASAAGGRVKRTRRMTYGAGMQGNTVTPAVTFTQRGLRIPVELPVNTTRWRWRAWNFDLSRNTAAKANMTGKGLVVGNAAWNSTGELSGDFDGPAVTLVSGDFTIPGAVPANNDWYGGVYTSPWFTDPAQQFTANVMRVIGTGVTLAASTSCQTIEQAAFFFATATDGADASKAGPAAGFLPFNAFIEYETVTDRACVLIVGDSISAGIVGPKGAAQSAAVPIPSARNYPNQWAKANNALVQQICISGFTAAGFADPASIPQVWERLDLTTPDFDLVIFALGSNDASTSTALATYQGYCATIFAKLRTYVRPGTPIWVVNVMPRALAAGPEGIRVSYNDWWARHPLQIAGVIDADGAFSNGTTGLKASMTMEGIHLSYTGTVRAATELERIPT